VILLVGIIGAVVLAKGSLTLRVHAESRAADEAEESREEALTR